MAELFGKLFDKNSKMVLHDIEVIFNEPMMENEDEVDDSNSFYEEDDEIEEDDDIDEINDEPLSINDYLDISRIKIGKIELFKKDK